MNDFFLALGRSIYIDLFGLEALEIRQITVEELENWLIVAQPIKDFLSDKDYSDAVLEQLFSEHGPYVIAICSLVTVFDQVSLMKLAQEQQEFIRLVRHVITVNQAYFKPEQPKRRGLKNNKKDDDKITWFDSFQILIRNGHTHTEILKLSYGAFIAYLKAANKAHRDFLAAQLNMARLAHHGDAKALKKYMDDLKTLN